MRAHDLLRIARQRAGLTQQQLADRSEHPRETIARWESGAREPSLSALLPVIEACDLDLTMHLAQRDSSLDDLVDDQLALSPPERLSRIMSAGSKAEALEVLRWLSNARTPSIVIGAMAAVLQGGPQRPRSAAVELVSGDPYAMEAEFRDSSLTPIDSEERWLDVDRRAAWTLSGGGTLVLAANVPGTGDHSDLRRGSRTIDLPDEGRVDVAHPRDLLRMADASPRESERARVPGLRALLGRTSEAEVST